MRKLLMMLLSLVFFASFVSAIVVTKVPADQTTIPITLTSGENIDVSIIKDYLDETKNSLVQEIEEVVLTKTNTFEKKIDAYFLTILSKIGLGFLSLTLFVFNLLLAKKLLIEMVFADA